MLVNVFQQPFRRQAPPASIITRRPRVRQRIPPHSSADDHPSPPRTAPAAPACLPPQAPPSCSRPERHRIKSASANRFGMSSMIRAHLPPRGHPRRSPRKPGALPPPAPSHARLMQHRQPWHILAAAGNRIFGMISFNTRAPWLPAEHQQLRLAPPAWLFRAISKNSARTGIPVTRALRK